MDNALYVSIGNSDDEHTEVYKDFSQKDIDEFIDKIARKHANYNDSNFIGYVDMEHIDPLFEDAARLILSNQMASTSLIQRNLSVGYNRACRIMDQLGNANIVGACKGSKPRELLCCTEMELEAKLKILNIGHDKEVAFYEKYKREIEERTMFYHHLIEKENEERERAIIEDEKERIKKKLLEKQRKSELKKKAMEELREVGLITSVKKREPIPQDVQDAVWRRDGGKCVKCGSQEKLEFDHIIPFSKGGSNTVRNLQLLCEKCNREKSNNIG